MSARAKLKQFTPQPLKSLVWKLREALAPPPIENVVLANYRLERDETERPRLTLVLPLLQKGSDFGGTATGIDIFCRLYRRVSSSEQCDLRVLITDVVSETDPTIAVERAAKSGVMISSEQVELINDQTARVAVRQREIFVTYNWWTTLNIASLRDQQATAFNMEPAPLIWLMQDYEPAFMSFSSAHMLARSAYDSCAPLWGVINSSNLANYIQAQGHKPDRTYCFEPVISEALRPYLDQVPTHKREKRLLVYGRPSVERNCFPALTRGIRRWVRDYPEFTDWEVVSAGVAHAPIDIGQGRRLVSVGKLSIEDYAQMLLGSSAGVSLMASPHPSYPPIEMAHFGLRTVTNNYLCKDWSDYHPNLVAVETIAERELATAIAEACRSASAPPADAADQSFLRTETYPFMGELAAAVGAALTGS